jgi:hypothetical protein
VEYSPARGSKTAAGNSEAKDGKAAGLRRPKTTKAVRVRTGSWATGCTSSPPFQASTHGSSLDVWSSGMRWNDSIDVDGCCGRHERPGSRTEGIAGSAMMGVVDGSRAHALAEGHSKDNPSTAVARPELTDGRGPVRTPSRSQGSAAPGHCPSSAWMGTAGGGHAGWNLDRSQPASCHHAQDVRCGPLLDPFDLIALSPAPSSWAPCPL